MTTASLRKEIHKAVDKVDDAMLLKQVQAILNKPKRKIQPLKPMTLKELFARDAKAEKDIKAGRLLPVEEVRKRFAIKK